MHGQRQAAVRALERGRALAAEHRAREPSTIEEHDRLFAPGQRLSHGVAQRGAQHDIRPRGRVLFAHVDDPDVGERTIEHAALQRDQRVPSLLRVLVALHRRRRRAQDRQGARLASAHDGDVATVVARRLLLLVGAVVLLVDDDEPDRAERREHGRSRADDDVDVATTDAVPLVVPLAVGQTAMLNGQPIGKRLTERGRHRRRQGNLRHEQQHTAALTPDLGRQPQVEFGLAAASDAVQERRLIRP